MNRITLSFSAILFVLIGGIPFATLRAQPPALGGGQSTLPSNEITNFSGTLKGMRRNLVIVEKEDGSEAVVAPPDTITAFQFVAKATPAFLQRGMLVRFTGNFGPGGVPLAPIDKVTLFQPVDLRSVQGRSKEQFTPGVHSDAKDKRGQVMAGKLTVVGHLITLTPGGILAVQAGKVPVQVPVTPDTQLEVRYNNLNLAQEGDKVNVAGFFQPPNENQIKAERITITTDRVYGEYQPEPKKRSRRKRGDDADQEKPESEKPESPKDDGEVDNDKLGHEEAGPAVKEDS